MFHPSKHLTPQHTVSPKKNPVKPRSVLNIGHFSGCFLVSRSESLGAKPQSVKQPPRLSSSTTAPPAPQPRQPETPEGPEVGAIADQDPPGAGKTRQPPQPIAVGRDPAGSLSRPAKTAQPPGPSVGPSVSPLLKKRKGRGPLPQILVEEVEEEMEETKGEEGNARTRFLESSGFPMEGGFKVLIPSRSFLWIVLLIAAFHREKKMHLKCNILGCGKR